MFGDPTESENSKHLDSQTEADMGEEILEFDSEDTWLDRVESTGELLKNLKKGNSKDLKKEEKEDSSPLNFFKTLNLQPKDEEKQERESVPTQL